MKKVRRKPKVYVRIIIIKKNMMQGPAATQQWFPVDKDRSAVARACALTVDSALDFGGSIQVSEIAKQQV